jgi:DNA-binding transcriptional MocR family regulator
MSADAINYVWRYSPAKHGTLCVHLAIAHTVNAPNDYEFWAHQAELASKARVSRQTANEALKYLETEGFLRRIARRELAIRYRFVFKRHVPKVWTTDVEKPTSMSENTTMNVVNDDTDSELQDKTEFISSQVATEGIRSARKALQKARRPTPG